MMAHKKTVKRQIKIGNCVLAEAYDRTSNARIFNFSTRRIDEIEALVRHRGQTGVSTWVRPLCDHLVLRRPVDLSEAALRSLVVHVVVVGPWLRGCEQELFGVAELAIVSPQRWTAVALGRALDLSEDERRLLEIRTIRFVGQTRAQQIEAKRRADRERQHLKRRAAGAIAQSERIAISVAEEARREGVSRMTIYRRRQREAGRECYTSVADKGVTDMSDASVTSGRDPTEWFRDVAADPVRRDAVAGLFKRAAEILDPAIPVPRRAAR